MSAVIGSSFQKGTKVSDLLKKINGAQEAGKPISVGIDDRSRPYMDHTVAAWTDGPPSSTVVWLFSGADPDGHHWRRFTFSKVGPWRYELACFPTPFTNMADALSPGIPPSGRRH